MHVLTDDPGHSRTNVPRLALSASRLFRSLASTSTVVDLELVAIKIKRAAENAEGYQLPVVAGDAVLHKLLRLLIALVHGKDDDILALVHLFLSYFRAGSFTNLFNLREGLVRRVQARREVNSVPLERGLWSTEHILQLKPPLFLFLRSRWLVCFNRQEMTSFCRV